MLKVRFVYHSCFTVELDHHVFVFDYFNPDDFIKKVCEGEYRIEKEGLPEKPVYFFASHDHPDHYSPRIFEFRDKCRDIHFVLSDDIKTDEKDGVTFVSIHGSYDIDDMKVETLESTDEGVAFLITVEGKTIYHAGDLNWWYWNEKGDEYVKTWGKKYSFEIDKIKDRHIDLAFAVLDPRLTTGYDAGLKDFLERVPDAPIVFPMHFWMKYALIKKFKRDVPGVLSDRVWDIEYEGQEFIIEP